jgi:hypothetical protein
MSVISGVTHHGLPRESIAETAEESAMLSNEMGKRSGQRRLQRADFEFLAAGPESAAFAEEVRCGAKGGCEKWGGGC